MLQMKHDFNFPLRIIGNLYLFTWLKAFLNDCLHGHHLLFKVHIDNITVCWNSFRFDNNRISTFAKKFDHFIFRLISRLDLFGKHKLLPVSISAVCLIQNIIIHHSNKNENKSPQFFPIGVKCFIMSANNSTIWKII